LVLFTRSDEILFLEKMAKNERKRFEKTKIISEKSKTLIGMRFFIMSLGVKQ